MSSTIEITKICEHCGNHFIAKKSSTRFCSKRCAEYAYKAAKRKEQIDRSQYPLLAQMMQTASGGVATPQVGTGSGGSHDQSSWDGHEHDPSRRKR